LPLLVILQALYQDLTRRTVNMGKFSAERLNDKVARSAVGRWFRLDGCGHPLARKGSRFTTELRAGSVIGAAMLYIIAVNSSVLVS
jgi:AGZA family xanthine/uracil permease-like MFS transporter